MQGCELRGACGPQGPLSLSAPAPALTHDALFIHTTAGEDITLLFLKTDPLSLAGILSKALWECWPLMVAPGGPADTAAGGTPLVLHHREGAESLLIR